MVSNFFSLLYSGMLRFKSNIIVSVARLVPDDNQLGKQAAKSLCYANLQNVKRSLTMNWIRLFAM